MLVSLSAPFYRATAVDPLGVVFRRRYTLDDGEISAYLDEHLETVLGHGEGRHRLGAAITAALLHRERAQAAARRWFAEEQPQPPAPVQQATE